MSPGQKNRFQFLLLFKALSKVDHVPEGTVYFILEGIGGFKGGQEGAQPMQTLFKPLQKSYNIHNY